MKNVVVIFAKNLEEAQQKASRELNLPPSSILFTKLDEIESDLLDGASPLESRYRAEPKQEHLVKDAEEKLRNLLDTMKLDAEIHADVVGNLIHLQVKSPEKSILIGSRGSTLNAIEHFINRVVNGGHKELPYVHIDVEGYNERRYKRLEREALHGVKRAQRNNRKVMLRPMKPDDRKIVHNLVKGMEGVISFSQGKARRRRVVIAPNTDDDNHKNPQLTGGVF